MSHKIRKPVQAIPPITREVTARRSKWDDVLDQAEVIAGTEVPALPVEFDNATAASQAARRIRARAAIRDGYFTVTSRGATVYVEKTD